MTAPKGFSRIQIGLHWIIAVLIVFQLIFGEDMTAVWRNLKKTGDAALTISAWVHIIAGVAVLVFSLWRVVVRFSRGAPEAPAAGSALAEKASAWVHGLLYLLMFALPLSGLLAWYGGVDVAAEAHELMKPLVIVLILAHVAAALWHHFWLKDGLLDRMRRPQN